LNHILRLFPTVEIALGEPQEPEPIERVQERPGLIVPLPQPADERSSQIGVIGVV
jgi:hypothetical protein